MNIVWATRRRREKPTVLLGETFQLETEEGENRNRHLPGQPRGAKLLEGALVTEQNSVSRKGVSQSYKDRRQGSSWELENKSKQKERKNQHLSK